MNKRYSFILIPLIALLYIYGGRGGGSVYTFQPSKTILSYTGSTGRGDISAANMQRDIPRQIKNKIRIKAWDDAVDIAIPAVPVKKVLFSYHSAPALVRYDFSFRPAHLSANSLRGPPLAA